MFFWTFVIKRLTEHKRRPSKKWQNSRLIEDKNKLNRVTNRLKNKKLKGMKNNSIQKYMKKLYPTHYSAYSVWKAARYLDTPEIVYLNFRNFIKF